METPATPSIQSYIESANQFFQTVKTPQVQKTPRVLTLDDIVSIASQSKTIEDAARKIGEQGEKYVLGEVKDAFSSEVEKAAQSKGPGVFSNIIKWIGDSKVGRSLGIGSEATAAAEGVAGAAEVVTTGAGAMNVLGALYGAYDLIKNFGTLSTAHGALSGLAAGAGIGSLILPGAGTAVGGLIGAAIGGILSLFKNSGKDKDQKARDLMRKALQQNGIIDDKFTIGLADGSRYDIGIDGGPKPEFGGRRAFEVDMNNPLMVKIATFLAPLTQVACGGNQKLAADLSGYLANAALSNAGGDEAKARENVQAIYGEFKIKPEDILHGLSQLTGSHTLSVDLVNKYSEILKELFANKTNKIK